MQNTVRIAGPLVILCNLGFEGLAKRVKGFTDYLRAIAASIAMSRSKPCWALLRVADR
jgi:hypothetical protein